MVFVGDTMFLLTRLRCVPARKMIDFISVSVISEMTPVKQL